LKDAAKLAAFFVAVLIVGALLAPPLYWAGHWAAAHRPFSALGHYDFESYFHRSLLVAALIGFWPLLRSLKVQNREGLQIRRNDRWWSDYLIGLVLAAVPLLCCAAILVATNWYNVRTHFRLSGIATSMLAAIVVPFIEETFFRGLVLGVLLRSLSRWVAVLASAALFAIIHFLKAPDQPSAAVTWMSGFASISRAFEQFGDLPLLIGGFCTLLILGCITADARILTRSLWLPIGLHAGWIATAGVFAKFARQKVVLLPWLGPTLLVGLIPLATAAVTWLLMRWWLAYAKTARPRAG